jgi:2-desacetyl-2-hydroxyethyl bacteriochlorophyllide A dehydrogenase
MKCLFIDGVEKVSLKECPIPKVGDNDVLIKLEARGICGTDLNSYKTGYPNGFGHEMAGYIYQKGMNVHAKLNQKVFVSNLTAMDLVSYSPDETFSYMGGFADYILVKNFKENVNVYPVPETMKYSGIALIEPFCVGMSGVKKCQYTQASHVVILGAGIIGMCCFEYLKYKGVKNIVIVDINEHRLNIAKKSGAIICNTKQTCLEDFLLEQFGLAYSMTKGEVPNVDVYIDCAGVGELTNQCVSMSKITTQMTILAVHHKPMLVDMMSVMYNNVTLEGSCMFTHEDILESIEIIANNPIIADELISHEIDFQDAKKAFEIANNPNESLKVMLIK